MINTRVIGSILLIVGMSIGGGLLALPVATAAGGFFKSSILLVIVWAITLASALFTLEVSLRLPKDNNLSSMARDTLGRPGQIICQISYLLLLYCLLCVYISAGTDVLGNLLGAMKLSLNHIINSTLFVVVFGAVVWHGIRFVDKTNRTLMSIKLLSFFLLIILLLPAVKLNNFISGSLHPLIINGLLTIIFSFGYSIIIPSLRTYLDGNVKQLRCAVIVGSLIPLVCYIAWIYVVQGTLTNQALVNLASGGHVVSGLTNGLSSAGHDHWLTTVAHLFTAICLLTSFLSVSLSLSDFISDGFSLKKSGKQKKWVYALTFLPPLLIILLYPGIFLTAIAYAGVLCVIIIILLPAAMVWGSRYHKNLSGSYQVSGGKYLPLLIMIISCALLVFSFFYRG